MLAAKVQEGRIAILVDGTPFALIVPYLFTENFQTLDDYAHSAFYASFIRIIRYFSFIISILLPGAYVAISTFHPELLPQALLFNIAAAEDTTPFPLGIEALIIHLLYEIMRELTEVAKERGYDLQQVYVAFGQTWPSKIRSEYMAEIIATDTHAPEELRVNVVLSATDGFYEAFGIEEGDGMYVAPEDRPQVW